MLRKTIGLRIQSLNIAAIALLQAETKGTPQQIGRGK